jgi:hypothetical protein
LKDESDKFEKENCKNPELTLIAYLKNFEDQRKMIIGEN